MPMLPEFLVPETTIREAGAGPDLILGEHAGKSLLVTLGITRIVEQESLDVSIWGSSDGSDWGAKPIATFPQKFYCGTYHLPLDLSANQEARFLRAKWQTNRWGRGETKPLFTMFVFVQQAQAAMTVAA